MRFVAYSLDNIEGLAAAEKTGPFHGYAVSDPDYPGSLSELVAGGSEKLLDAGRVLLSGPEVDLGTARYLPPLPHPPKIVCIGLNYAEHSAESGFKVPDYPTVFGRFASSLIGNGDPIIRPLVSEQLDFEGEFVAVIGRGGRDIPVATALDHVVGYTLFNDGSIRDYQFKSPNGRWARISTRPVHLDRGSSPPTSCRRAVAACDWRRG